MANNTPSFLKLHTEEEYNEVIHPKIEDLPGLPDVCDAFAKVTGWSLGYSSDRADSDTSDWSADFGQEDGASGTMFMQRPAVESLASQGITWPLALEQSTSLAQSIGGLVNQLHRAHFAIWQREAELATAIPVSTRPDEEAHLAERLEAILRVGSRRLDCDAAALYMLDDATSQLKLRACFGIAREKFLDSARELRGSVADLEALIGHAVVLEDTSLLPQWKSPEDFPSAMVVPVSTPTSPLGTLWFFSKAKRDFTEEHTELAEIIAGRISSDLEREILLQHSLESRVQERKLRSAADWQFDRLPDFPPLVDDWEIAGWTSQTEVVGGAAHDWAILNDGTLAATVLDAEGENVESALTLASLQGALKALAPNCGSAKQFLNQLNDSVWTASCGDQFANLGFVRVQPETGDVEFASAGTVELFRIHRRGYERLSTEPTPLGVQPDQIYRQKKLELKHGEMLLLVSAGARQVLDDDDRPTIERAIEHLAHKGQDESVEDLVTYIQVLLDSAAVRPAVDISLALLRRRG
ncbi:MAG: sigma-B regulation protein RsbU (phosphoserine phosphatase) [Pirellulaceae bacterium]